jgi:hypothetical protein
LARLRVKGAAEVKGSFFVKLSTSFPPSMMSFFSRFSCSKVFQSGSDVRNRLAGEFLRMTLDVKSSSSYSLLTRAEGWLDFNENLSALSREIESSN